MSLFELCQNPDKLENMKEEVDRVLGAKPHVTKQDVDDLVYTGCVFKETLRKYPPVPLNPRFVTDDDLTIMGLKIPKNTEVHVRKVNLVKCKF